MITEDEAVRRQFLAIAPDVKFPVALKPDAFGPNIVDARGAVLVTGRMCETVIEARLQHRMIMMFVAAVNTLAGYKATADGRWVMGP